MLIRTQSKMQLVNFGNYNGIAISYQSDTDFSVSAVLEVDADNISHVLLGNYSSEEKALKVMDTIEEFYNNCFSFTMENNGCYHEVSERKVFQMPKDETM